MFSVVIFFQGLGHLARQQKCVHLRKIADCSNRHGKRKIIKKKKNHNWAGGSSKKKL